MLRIRPWYCIRRCCWLHCFYRCFVVDRSPLSIRSSVSWWCFFSYRCWISWWWETSSFLFFYRLIHYYLFFFHFQYNSSFYRLLPRCFDPYCSWCFYSCRCCCCCSCIMRILHTRGFSIRVACSTKRTQYLFCDHFFYPNPLFVSTAPTRYRCRYWSSNY